MALTKVTSGVRTLATDEVGATEIAAGAVGASEIASTIDLSSKTVTLPAASVTTHVTQTDLSPVRNDIATLALHSAIADNKAAYNLSNAFIDQFENDTGLDVQTDCDRDATEYMGTIQDGYGIDSNTKIALHMDGANDGTVFTDSSGNSHNFTASASGANTVTGTKKFGTASLHLNGTSGFISVASHADFNFGTGNWTLDCWMKDDSGTSWSPLYDTRTQSTDEGGIHWTFNPDNAARMRFHSFQTSPAMANSIVTSASSSIPGDSNWHHVAITRNGNNLTLYVGGVPGTALSIAGHDEDNTRTRFIGKNQHNDPADEFFKGYIDEWRMSNVCRTTDSTDPLYISSGTTFTPPIKAYYAEAASATANFTSVTQASAASVSSMGIVVLYKDNAGTASLNGDLVAQVSANGGTNYANATLVAGGTFSTGIKIAAVSGVAVTAGTTPKYKISFANQASGSKETQVHGVALLY